MSSENRKSFNSEQEASDWMYNEALIDEQCTDNYRFAFEDDNDAMNAYQNAQSSGCCGYFDEEIVVNGRVANIGCNFGH